MREAIRRPTGGWRARPGTTALAQNLSNPCPDPVRPPLYLPRGPAHSAEPTPFEVLGGLVCRPKSRPKKSLIF